MGIFRKVGSKLKSIESIIQELKNTGLAKEEINMFEEINDVLQSNLKDANKINRKIDKVTVNWNKASYRIEKIERRMEKIKEKTGAAGFTLFFNSEYKSLKKQLKMAKTSRKLADRSLKTLMARLKVTNKKIKRTSKKLKFKGKEIRAIWEQHKFHIKFVNEFEYKRDKLEKVYDQESLTAIKCCVRALRENGDLPLGMDIEVLFKEMRKAEKSKTPQEFSVVRIARERGTTVKGLLELKHKKTEEKHKNQENVQNYEDREEDIKYEQSEEKETENEREEEQTQSQEEKHEEEEKEDTQEKDQEENNKKENKFKEDLNMKYFTDRGINVSTIQSVLNNSHIDLTPKQLLLFIGTLRLETMKGQKFASKDAVKAEVNRIYQEIRSGKSEEIGKSEEYYIQTGAHVFYDIYQGKVPKDAGEKFVHPIVMKYIKEEQKMQEQDSSEKQKDENTITRGA